MEKNLKEDLEKEGLYSCALLIMRWVIAERKISFGGIKVIGKHKKDDL